MISGVTTLAVYLHPDVTTEHLVAGRMLRARVCKSVRFAPGTCATAHSSVAKASGIVACRRHT